MQFLITAYDGPNSDRMAVRPAHLENLKPYIENRNIIAAGGLTNEEGKMIGSFLVLNFESRDALDQYLETEPYVLYKIWKDINISTCNVVISSELKK